MGVGRQTAAALRQQVCVPEFQIQSRLFVDAIKVLRTARDRVDDVGEGVDRDIDKARAERPPT